MRPVLRSAIPLLIVIIGCNGQIKTSNREACKQVEGQLSIVQNFVEGKSDDRALKRAAAIHFLEKLTGLISQSDGNDLGKLNPTLKDYISWVEWYKQNKDKLLLSAPAVPR